LAPLKSGAFFLVGSGRGSEQWADRQARTRSSWQWAVAVGSGSGQIVNVLQLQEVGDFHHKC